MKKFCASLFISLLFFSSLIALPFDPDILYLTWQSHPESTMTIQWISDKSHHEDSVELSDGSTWHLEQGKHSYLSPEKSYLVHRVVLTHLQPNTQYAFRLDPEGKIYKFRTLPDTLNKPLQFVVGGDMYHDGLSYLMEMNRQAAATNPAFALLGGDLAYANGHQSIWQSIGSFFGMVDEKVTPWLEFLRAWKSTMITADGNLIPIVTTLGNHDVVGGFNQTPDSAKIYYKLFPVEGYRVLDFGNYMSVVILDTQHTHPIIGAQSIWLANCLLTRHSVPHKFALYHVGAYPSVRNYNDDIHAAIRYAWVPAFETFGINAAFEHHDHSYKRTFPLRNGKVDPKGVVYIGDGGWGVKKARRPKKRNYLAMSAASRNFIKVTISPDERFFEAINERGEVFDSYKQSQIALDTSQIEK